MNAIPCYVTLHTGQTVACTADSTDTCRLMKSTVAPLSQFFVYEELVIIVEGIIVTSFQMLSFVHTAQLIYKILKCEFFIVQLLC